MSSYHVLKASGKGGNYRIGVEFHIPIPNEQNTTGTSSLRDALVGDADIDKTTDVGTPQEQTDLSTGTLLKVIQSVLVHEAKSLVQKRSLIRAEFNNLEISAVNAVRARYDFIGFNETKGVDF